jgi:ribosome-associated translation inhibitor RaiA
MRTMKFLLLQPGNIRPRPVIERLVERRLLALHHRERVEEAIVRLGDERDAGPRFRVRVFLRIPGPDIHATAADRTMSGAVEKAFAAVEAQIRARRGRRVARRRRAPLLTPGGFGW